MGGWVRDEEGTEVGDQGGGEGDGFEIEVGLLGVVSGRIGMDSNRNGRGDEEKDVAGDVGLSGRSRHIPGMDKRRRRQSREREIVRWIARMGAVSVEHVRRRWAVGRSVGYALVARLVEAGLLERVATLPGDPTLLRATHYGLRYGRVGLSVAKISPGQVDHWLACADVALWAEGRWGADALMSERELRFAELESRQSIGSAVVGELHYGRELFHRPDFLVTDNGQAVAIEVELTPKAPRRLEHLVKSWWRARNVGQVIYVVPEGPTERAVKRAIDRAYAGDRVRLISLGDVALP